MVLRKLEEMANGSTLKFTDERYLVRTIYLGLREKGNAKRKNATVKGRGELEDKDSERMNGWSGECEREN